jgi:molybdopterin molybdotransferase
MSKLSFETSQNMLKLLSVSKIKRERVFLSDSLGRILAEDIVAQVDYPHEPTASMDGYAIKFEDQEGGRIKIIADNPAGGENSVSVNSGECVKTFTGSLMPYGANTLINIENVSVEDDHIIINNQVEKGFAIRAVGESYFKGDVLIKKGVKIGFAQIGVMAGLNEVMISVVKKPTVSILATGSEILDIGATQTSASQIRSSNNYTLEAIAKLSGANVAQLGVVKDDKASIKEAFLNALSLSDIVVSTGGVSVGDYDFVKDIVPSLGAKLLYHGVNIKPAQHILLAQYDDKFIVALPGFAYSSTVAFILYVVPLIKKMLGVDMDFKMLEATLKEPFKKRSDKTEFSACNLYFEDGKYYVDFSGIKSGSSAILTNLLGENSALMITGESDQDLEVGTLVNVMSLDRF